MTTYLDILPIELQEKIYDMTHEMEEEQRRAQEIIERYGSLMNMSIEELINKCDDVEIPIHSYCHLVKCNYVNMLISFELLKDESSEFLKEMCDEFETPPHWVKDCTSKMEFIMLLEEDYVEKKLKIDVGRFDGCYAVYESEYDYDDTESDDE